MNITELLTPECIQVGSAAKSKAQVLQELAALLKNSAATSEINQADLVKGLQERETVGSTGFGNGIAIPHCAATQATAFALALLLPGKGIDFDSLDGKPTNIFFAIAAPEGARNEHIHLLSNISHLLHDGDIISELLAADSAASAYSVLQRHSENKSEPLRKTDHSIIHIFVKREDLISEILETITAAAVGTISVIEASASQNYLYALPLLSSFWSEQKNEYLKVIVSIIPDSLLNDTLRRINTINNHQADGRGLLAVAQKIDYLSGSLEL